MSKDYIVDEVRRAREELAVRHDFDRNALLRAAKKRQLKSGHRVSFFVAKKKTTA